MPDLGCGQSTGLEIAFVLPLVVVRLPLSTSHGMPKGR